MPDFVFKLEGLKQHRLRPVDPFEGRQHTIALARRLGPELNPAWLGLTDAEVWVGEDTEGESCQGSRGHP